MNGKKKLLKAKRKSWELTGDQKRVILRYFQSGSTERKNEIIRRVLNFSEDQVEKLFNETMKRHENRHKNFERLLEELYSERLVCDLSCFSSGINDKSLSRERRLLLTTYFAMEYSIESAALFNPSIVAHPNQKSVKNGSLRFIMSFRAIGEGHISSITFRSGVIHANGSITFDPVSRLVETPILQTNTTYDKHLFSLKLNEMGACDECTASALDQLEEEFTLEQLLATLIEIKERAAFPKGKCEQAFTTMEWLARSNYEVEFRPDRRISERIIFPVSANESNGIEDARFVRFIDDNGTSTYYATYTAYNGAKILPQLLETRDFVRFKAITLNGKAAQNKGMALFPRKIDGKFYMISRCDGVNLYIMTSDNIHFWQEAKLLQRPENPWELIQIGNCGSPVETEAGWLLLTHGVGPVRRYCLGIDLLDLHDPTKVIAHLDEPLLEPDEHERDGYVPNVVYTCGCMIHNDELIIPYAMSDTKCSIAGVSVRELLDKLTS